MAFNGRTRELTLSAAAGTAAAIVAMAIGAFTFFGQFAKAETLRDARQELKQEIGEVRAEQGRRTGVVYGVTGRLDAIEAQLGLIRGDIADLRSELRRARGRGP